MNLFLEQCVQEQGGGGQLSALLYSFVSVRDYGGWALIRMLGKLHDFSVHLQQKGYWVMSLQTIYL